MRHSHLISVSAIAVITAILPVVSPVLTVAQTIETAVAASRPSADRAQLVRSLAAHDGPVHDFALSPDGNTIASSGSRDRTVRIFKWRDNLQDFRIDADGSSTWFSSVNLSPDGQTLVTRRSDGVIQLRDLGGQVKTTLSPTGSSGIAAIAADNRTLVDVSEANDRFSIRLWNLADRQARELGSTTAGLAAITPTGDRLVTADATGTATVWDLDNGQRSSTLTAGTTQDATAIALSADGLRLFVAKAGRVEEWNVPSGRLTRSLLQTRANIIALAVSPDGETLAIGFGNYMQMRNLRSNQALYNLPSHANSQQVLRFSPDGRLFFNSDGSSSIAREEVVNDRLRVWQLP